MSLIALLCALLWPAPSRQAQPPRAGEAAFRALYTELVEINTTLSAGSCTAAAEAMAARLKAAGLPSSDIPILAPADRPKDGNLIATLHGQDRQATPILLLAHIDVVEAKREDWERDPFKLVEYDGWFYAPALAADIRAVLKDPPDEAAAERLWSGNASWNSMMRTTCVATNLQSAIANLRCSLGSRRASASRRVPRSSAAA